MHSITSYIQIISAVLLIIAILMQASSAGVGAAFGGGDSDVGFNTRRGPERIIFIATIVLAVIFAASSILVFVQG